MTLNNLILENISPEATKLKLAFRLGLPVTVVGPEMDKMAAQGLLTKKAQGYYCVRGKKPSKKAVV